MSTCEHYIDQLSDFLDGTLDSTRSIALSAHMEECSHCRREYNALRNTLNLLHSAVVPDGVQEHRYVLAKLRSSISTEAASTRRTPLSGFRFAAASLAAAVLLAVVLGRYSLVSFESPVVRGNVQDNLIVSTATANNLPTSSELDEMATLHAVQSIAVSAGDGGDQQDTLADATSRLSTRDH